MRPWPRIAAVAVAVEIESPSRCFVVVVVVVVLVLFLRRGAGTKRNHDGIIYTGMIVMYGLCIYIQIYLRPSRTAAAAVVLAIGLSRTGVGVGQCRHSL